MLDNVAKQAIIGWVDGRLRLVRHSDFMSSTALRGNHRQENEQRSKYSNYRATNEIAWIIRVMRAQKGVFERKRTGWSEKGVANRQRFKN
ncbi:hypothetical protein [Pantoea rwandensis]|uniref:Uncharacterized protein n=1 Tax=Pantoea rwandensis TaxID=1076550 RepID=A0A1X1CS62_9GAMM|nr:hypothetical protein [Pantoea rwandensis]ORM67164.1 hypothetical protein HA51_20455 [Pantoea rwandensis]